MIDSMKPRGMDLFGPRGLCALLACALVAGACGERIDDAEDPCPNGSDHCEEPEETCPEGECVEGCEIDGIEHDPEAPHPDQPCLVCDPTVSTTDFTAAPAQTPCGEGRVCDGAGACIDDTPTLETLEVTLEGNGTGVVMSSPEGIDCGPSCVFEYESGAAVTLEALAGTGSTFSAWSGACSGALTTCVVTMDQARAVTATFSLEDHALTVTLEGDGTGTVTSDPAGIDCGGTCAATFTDGLSVTLMPVADDSSIFVGWTGDCVGASCTLSMEGPREATAQFALQEYILTYTAGDHGSIEGETPQVVVHGESGTAVTARPDGGYRFLTWSDGVETDTRVDTNVESDLSVTAEFEEMDFEWAAWPIPPEQPDAYTMGDDTVTDDVTDLIWQRNAPTVNYNWINAQAYCEDLVLAGESDWRLPTIVELESIVSFDDEAPTIDTTAFPGTPSMRFWSSTRTAFSQYDAWTVSFSLGYPIASATVFNNTNRVRCVRSEGDGAPEERYSIYHDVVHDDVTGLIWQRAVPSQIHNWEGATGYCESLSLDGQSDWRLPNVKELHSLVDVRRFDPSIDTQTFPSTPSSRFWTSTRSLLTASGALWIDFDSGGAGANDEIYEYRVRCVR